MRSSFGTIARQRKNTNAEAAAVTGSFAGEENFISKRRNPFWQNSLKHHPRPVLPAQNPESSMGLKIKDPKMRATLKKKKDKEHKKLQMSQEQSPSKDNFEIQHFEATSGGAGDTIEYHEEVDINNIKISIKQGVSDPTSRF